MRGPEELAALRAEMENDISASTRIFERFGTSPDEMRSLSAAEPLVASTAFEIHNYYSIVENLMRRVATAFENALDPGEWHKQLLSRMSLDIPGVRPALIDPKLREELDELRKFRHFFRNAYDRPLNPSKVADILAVLFACHTSWIAAVRRFLDWLGDLAKRLGGQGSTPAGP